MLLMGTAGDDYNPEEEGSVNNGTQLSLVETLLSAGVMGFVMCLSTYLGLDLESQIGIATMRTVVQLSILGYILEPVFSVDSPLPILGVVVFMLTVVAFEARGRLIYTYKGIERHIVLSTLLGVSFSVFVALAVVRPVPWWSSQYVVPLFGMLLGASLTAVCLGLGELMSGLGGSPGDNVEFLLAQGATRAEAIAPLRNGAISKGLVPTINTMNVIGLVAIPGMMTGQILGGASPMQVHDM